uniref:Putative conserved secreted protein n=1 Tax=Phlebotomus kandelakii TaxID=1109342 RepID=A0A6B2E9J9_9DIPT
MLPIFMTFLLFGVLDEAYPQSLTTHSLRKTPAAAAKGNDLWCYACETMEDGEMCADVQSGNHSNLIRKCKAEEFSCMVKRFSYTITTENSTTPPRMWSLQRQCASNCERGCIVIGERTKLYACTSCCETSLCNTDDGSAPPGFHLATQALLTGIALVLVATARRSMSV